MWGTLERLADSDKDGKVSCDEYLATYERLLVQRGPDFRVADSIFDLADANGDGRIVESEYVAFLGAYGVAEAGARESFRRLDGDGDGHVTRDEFTQAARDFFLSDDPNAPGTWLFGPLTSDRE